MRGRNRWARSVRLWLAVLCAALVHTGRSAAEDGVQRRTPLVVVEAIRPEEIPEDLGRLVPLPQLPAIVCNHVQCQRNVGRGVGEYAR